MGALFLARFVVSFKKCYESLCTAKELDPNYLSLDAYMQALRATLRTFTEEDCEHFGLLLTYRDILLGLDKGLLTHELHGDVRTLFFALDYAKVLRIRDLS